MPTIEQLLTQIRQQPESLQLEELLACIDRHYSYTPRAFFNGPLHNDAGANTLSCKLFAFGLLHQLTEQEVLACFAHHYFQTVLRDPHGQGHQNIRQFMQTGWAGIRFDAEVLVPLS